MKILSVTQVQQADTYTILNEPVKSIDLMERASNKFVEALKELCQEHYKIAIVCGPGNNGGDGLAVSRILLNQGYKVQPVVVQPKAGGSQDFLTNLERLRHQAVHKINSAAEIPNFATYDVIIDAIFGSGLTRPVSGLFAEVIETLNRQAKMIVAIDMPSGLIMDSPAPDGAIIKARHTISFHLPKLAFFFPENFAYVGDWQVVDIGLNESFIVGQETEYETLDHQTVKTYLPPRLKFDHKGNYGHAQLIGGSFGKIGAMVLACEAALRAGAGLVSANIPQCGQNILQTAVPEAMLIEQIGQQEIQEFNVLDKANVIGLGPGLGNHKKTAQALGEFLRGNDKSLVIDADGLNILAAQSEYMELLPSQTILTPHLKEFDRIAGDSKDNWQRLAKAKTLASQNDIIIVLKGAHTAIIEPDETVSFNTSGNPGMATGGSGDVLFGIITGLLAQGLSPLQAARLGVYLHGLAGDLAAEQISEQALIAGDIIDYIGEAFLNLDR